MALNIRRILKQHGCQRVSKQAVKRLEQLCNDLLSKLAVESCNNARIFGRKTIKKEDVERAWQMLRH